MSEKTPPSDTSLGLSAPPRRDGFTAIEMIATGVSAAWLLVTGAFFLFFAEPADPAGSAYRTAVILMAVFLPAILVWVVAASARSGQILREESLNLQDAAALIRQAAQAQHPPRVVEAPPPARIIAAPVPEAPVPEGPVPESPAPEAPVPAPMSPPQPDPALVPFSTSRQPGAAPAAPSASPTPGLDTDEPGLPFEPQTDDVHPPLGASDFILALNFPQTADDTAGFDALRRALRHREAAQIIQASQDVLTLLSQDGIYMDDLPPDMAHPDLWRRFAAGERGRQIAALGGIHDRSSLALSAARMKQDTIFRDASHHFLRLYDRMMSRFCETAEDAEISALSDTRTSRAFMLLGRVAGTFD